MPGLDRSLMEHRLALKLNARPMKQTPRHFAPKINVKIKEEIECLIKAKSIRTASYVEWVLNIVPVMKKNGKLRVCIDFRDLNNASLKDEYFMPIADMLINSAAENEILSFMDGYSGYNQIFITEDDVAKTAFRCPGALGTYEWVVMPSGLKNAGATYQRAMNAIFHEFIGTFMEVYIDDVMVKSISCYMVAKSVKFIAQTDLVKYKLSFPMLRGRLGKWMLALTEFDLQYVPTKAVKGQVIADFLMGNLKGLNDQRANIVDVEINYWKLYFDGSKHKDGAGVRILIISPEGIPSEFWFELKYPCFNNVAEYEALILGLEILIDKGALEVSLMHIPRIHNEIANELAQIASRYRVGPETLKKLSGIHQILVPANEREVLCMDKWEDSDWRKPIALYLKDPNIVVDRKIKLQSMNFVLLADDLYKKGIDESLLRCLSRDDQNIAIGEVHNGICGAHQARKKMRWVEAVPLIEVGQSEIIDFVEEHITHRFEIPQTLSTDQRTMFTSQRVKNFTASRSINMVTSTPYYAQANGQVEAANKILISLIKSTSEISLEHGMKL
ncbi:uncharacterized protein [Arachis hypogaea]|uniref:uncharacterized protein n=1 Tax=Arachis hypogaea TaxID=3818 RepID=UPI003B22899B